VTTVHRGAYILDYVPEDLITRTELAERLGVHYHTIYTWERQGKLVPTAYMESGKTEVPLFDINAAEALAAEFREEEGDASSV
jgi:hypothetical protein